MCKFVYSQSNCSVQYVNTATQRIASDMAYIYSLIHHFLCPCVTVLNIQLWYGYTLFYSQVWLSGACKAN